MTLFKGFAANRTFVERVLDAVLDLRALTAGAAILFAFSVIASPIVMFIDFRYFTAATAPWWLNVLDYGWVLGVILGGAMLTLLLLAKAIGTRHEENDRPSDIPRI